MQLGGATPHNQQIALFIDTSRKIHGPSARRALVEAVRDATPHEPETDWIEWKSQADLSDKAWQGELASHILGFANRDPRSAARNVQGYAYLIVGAEAASSAGIDPIDSAQLDDGIARFAGSADGPGWEPDYVNLDGQEVLVITVDPPQSGDPIWPLRKAFTDPAGKTHHDGRIFIRRTGKTSPQPTAAEIDMLQRRSERVESRLDLDVVVEGDAEISPLEVSELGRKRWLEKERARRLAKLPANTGTPVHSVPYVIPSPFEEQRSPDAFRKEVDDYLAEAADVFTQIARVEAVEAGVGRLRLSVHNNSNDNFHKLLVEMYLEGEVLAFFDADDAAEGFDWPKPPRAYGTSRLAGLGAFDVPPVKPFRSGAIDNSASARIRFPVFDLRPGYKMDLDDVHLVVDQSQAGGELLATWVATSTSVSGSARGDLTLPIAGEAVFVDAFSGKGKG